VFIPFGGLVQSAPVTTVGDLLSITDTSQPSPDDAALI
jgi:hypothetical protein